MLRDIAHHELSISLKTRLLLVLESSSRLLNVPTHLPNSHLFTEEQ